MKIFNWLKSLFGFGPKKEVKVIKLKNGGSILVPTESYKVEHKTPNYVKGGESMVYPSSTTIVFNRPKDDFEKALDSFKEAVDKRYPKPSEPDTSILGDYIVGEALNDMLNTSYDSISNYDDNSSSYDTNSSYDSGSSSYDSGSNYDSSSSSYDSSSSYE